MPDNQVFQNWIFIVHRHGELLQTSNRHQKADATDAVTLLESKDCSLFNFYNDPVILVIDDEWRGR